MFRAGWRLHEATVLLLLLADRILEDAREN